LRSFLLKGNGSQNFLIGVVFLSRMPILGTPFLLRMRKSTILAAIACVLITASPHMVSADTADSICYKPYPVQFRFLNDFASKIEQYNDTAKRNAAINELLATATKAGDEQFKYQIRILNSRYLFREGDTKKEDYLLELLKNAEKTKFSYVKAGLLQTLGEYYWGAVKNYTLSLEYLLRAHDLYSSFSANDFPNKGNFLFDLGGKYYYFRDFYTAKNYFLEYVPELMAGDVEGRISKLNTIGLCYRNLSMPDSAKYYLLYARTIANKNNDAIWVGMLNGNLGAIYAANGEYDKAIPLLEIDVQLSLQQNELGSAARAMASLGVIYSIKKDRQKAWYWAQRAINLIYEKQLWSELTMRKVAYPDLANVYSAYGYPGKAYQLMDSAATASDIIEKERTLQYLSGVQHKLDAERHFSELKLKESEIAKERLFRNSFLLGFASVLLFSVLLYRQKKRITRQKHISDNLLKNILPEETAEELKRTGAAKAKNYDSVTVLFTDFKNFTAVSARLSAEQLVQEINYYYSQFDTIVSKYNLEKIKTIGDSYMCAGGLPVATITHAVDVIDAAVDMISFVEKEKTLRERTGRVFLEMRIGINTGAVVAGIVGIKKFTYDIWGDTVNIASRMESAGSEGLINISESTYELVKDKYQCTYRGEIEAKNRQKLKMYFVETGLKPLAAGAVAGESTIQDVLA
jgi:adenylate cyclase